MRRDYTTGRDMRTLRACIECDKMYRGPLQCPICKAPGEPLPQADVETGEEHNGHRERNRHSHRGGLR